MPELTTKPKAIRKEYKLIKGLTQAGNFIDAGEPIKLTDNQYKRLKGEYVK